MANVLNNTTEQPMNGYGDSWFTKLENLSTEYELVKAEKLAAKAEAAAATAVAVTIGAAQAAAAVVATAAVTPVVMNNYGDSWFENLNSQRLQFEEAASQKSQPQQQQSAAAAPANHGAEWFDTYEQMWEEWQLAKLAKKGSKSTL